MSPRPARSVAGSGRTGARRAAALRQAPRARRGRAAAACQSRRHRARAARAVSRGAVRSMSADDEEGLRNTLYRTTTRSGRRMTPMRRWLYRLIVPLALGIIRGWWLTWRLVRVDGGDQFDAAL